MKRIGLLLLLMVSSAVFAQGEFGTKSNSISGSGINLTKPNAPSVFAPSLTSPSKSILDKKPIQFSQENKFANPGDPVKSKLNQKEKEYNPDFVKRDQFFGEFKTKSEYVRICYRDYGQVDQDVVSIYTPDMVLLPNGILDSECQYIKLNLVKGENRITLQALNEGFAPPNTGELQIFDDKGNVLTDNQWGLGQGFSASVIIYKE